MAPLYRPLQASLILSLLLLLPLASAYLVPPGVLQQKCPVIGTTEVPGFGANAEEVSKLPGWVPGRFVDFEDPRFGRSLVYGEHHRTARECYLKALCDPQSSATLISWKGETHSATRGFCAHYKEDACSTGHYTGNYPFEANLMYWLSTSFASGNIIGDFDCPI